MSSTTRSTGCSPKRCERLLAVGRLNDAVAVALEREAEHLPHGLVVVDEQNGGGARSLGFSVSSACLSAPACVLAVPASYYSPGWRPQRPPAGAAGGLAAARSRGRSTGGSTAPRSCSSLASAAAARVHDHPADAAREAGASGLLRHQLGASRSLSDLDHAVSGPRAGKHRRDGRGGLVLDQLPPQLYGLKLTRSSWTQNVAGLGRVRLREHRGGRAGPVARRDRRHGPSRRRRDGPGRERQRERDGRADRARPRRSPSPRPRGHAVQSPQTIVFLSTDAGAYGGLGAVHFLATSPFRKRIAAVINLDAIGGHGPREHRDRRRPAALAEPERSSRRRSRGSPSRPATSPRHVGFFGQLIDLAFPFTLYEQGPFVAAGIPAVTITTGGDRPPAAFGDDARGPRRDAAGPARRGRPAAARLARPGPRARPELVELRLGRRAGRPGLGDRARPDRPARALRASRSSISTRSAAGTGSRSGQRRGALRSRLVFWLFVGVVFTCFRLLGAWPSGPAAAAEPGNGRRRRLARARADRRSASSLASAGCSPASA